MKTLKENIMNDPVYEKFYAALKIQLETNWFRKQSVLGDEIGISKGYMSEVVKKKKKLTFEFREKLASVCGYTYEEFLNLGERALNKGSKTGKTADRPFVVQTLEESTKNQINTEHFRAIPLDESGKLAAWSNGAEFNPYAEASSHVIVHLPELKGHARHNLVAAVVGGNSMDPIIPQGAIVVIDLDDKEFVDGKIFVCRWNDSDVYIPVIKRVRKFEKAEGFVLLSENRDYSPLLSTDEWGRLCIGRVVWMWRDILNG